MGWSHVRLRANGHSSSYRVDALTRKNSSDGQLWVAEGELGLVANVDTEVAISRSTKFATDLRTIIETGYGWVLLCGLLFGLVGLGLDAAAEIGKRGYVWFQCTPLQMLASYLAAELLKALGLLSAFLTASFFKKE